MVEGCGVHGVTDAEVGGRWAQVSSIIARTPEDDHAAQWSAIGLCGCCEGPIKVSSIIQGSKGMCTRCVEVRQ